jgi:peptide deformylase
MAILRIRTVGDPVLRREVEKIEAISDETRALAESMVETMHANRGIGLAAPQVGESVSLIIVPSSPDWEHAVPTAVINPVLSGLEGVKVDEEGCLSVPGFSENVERSACCILTGLDLKGNEIRIEAEEFLARVFQHEVDHLNGVLYLDRLSPLKRDLIIRKIEREQREQE